MSEDNVTEEDNVEPETDETPEEDSTPQELPDDHPLVKTLAKQRAELKELKKNYTQANRELDEIKKANLSDQERLVEDAKSETAKTIRMEFAEKLVEAELKSALKGRSVPGDALLSFDKASFVDDDGDIDSEAIATWVDAHSEQAQTPTPDLGQGVRGSSKSQAQIRSRDELKNMTPDAILEARKDGRLDSLMGKL